MKAVIIMLLFLCTGRFAIANEIDSLKTQHEVQNFLSKRINHQWPKDFFKDIERKDTTVLGNELFFKLDLDHNGLTDLVVEGKYLLAIIDSGGGRYTSHFIDRGAFMLDKHKLKNIIYREQIPLLIITEYENPNHRRADITRTTDTLIFKFGGFAEYNSAPSHLKIKEISFHTSACFGTCPIFELSIKADKSAIYDAIEYNDTKGTFKTTIDPLSFDALIQTINYIRLKSLKNKYRVAWTDDQTTTLRITLNNGQVKEITDYGAIGTYGLACLYRQLFALRKTQKWE